MEITDKNFKKEVLGSKTPVFLEFWASWCPPCKMMAPILKKLEDKYKEKIKIFALNIDKNRLISDKYSILGVPTFIIFNKGKEIAREVAAKSEAELAKFIRKNLK